MPRIQNKEYTLRFSDFQSGTPILLTEQTDVYWIDTVTSFLFFTYKQQPIYLLPDLNSFLTLLPNNGFMHVAKFLSNGTFQQFLTSGNFDVFQLVGYYPPSNTL